MARLRFALVLLLLSSSSCITYTGVSRTDRKLYISGVTSYWVFSTPFIKRCDEDGLIIRCEELMEPKGAAPAAAAPATATSAPAAPASSSGK